MTKEGEVFGWWDDSALLVFCVRQREGYQLTRE